MFISTHPYAAFLIIKEKSYIVISLGKKMLQKLKDRSQDASLIFLFIKGDCICGECICHEEGNIRYSGRHCNKCPTCPSRCEELKPCVQCQMYSTGNYSDPEECARNCKEFVPEGVETVIVDVDNDEVPCFGTDEDDCKYNFVYYYNETNCLQVRAQNERECPPQVYMLGIVLGVIAAVVLIGLALLLLWKLLTTIHDRREFARFEKERMMAKWDTVQFL